MVYGAVRLYTVVGAATGIGSQSASWRNMKLFHSTTAQAADAILVSGFAVSHVKDSVGHAWLCSSVESTQTGRDPEVLVVVEIPAEVAECYRYRFDDGSPYLDNYLTPFKVVNSYMPFGTQSL